MGLTLSSDCTSSLFPHFIVLDRTGSEVFIIYKLSPSLKEDLSVCVHTYHV